MDIILSLVSIGTTHNGGYNHETLVYALKDCGYRLIDTAKRYGTETYIGQAVKDSGVPRYVRMLNQLVDHLHDRD